MGESKRKGKCNMCGMCCRAIVLNMTYQEIENYYKDYRDQNKEFSDEEIEKWAFEQDAAFVHLFWKHITKEEAFKINPHLKLWFGGKINQDINKSSFWTCTKFDSKTNKCTVQDKKPSVCSEYPYYGRAISKNEPFYSLNCGYKADRGNA